MTSPGIGRAVGVLTCASLLLGSPVALRAQSREERQLNADMRMLQLQTQRLELMLNSLATTLASLSGQLDEQEGVHRKTFADLKLLSDNISGDVRVLREKIDETNVRLGSMGQEIQGLQMSVQAIQLAPPVIYPGNPTTDDSLNPSPIPIVPTAVAGAGTDVPPGVFPSQAFEEAHGDYMAGQYSLAVQGFEAFIGYFPDLPQAAEAQYYIGESYRSSGQPEDAVRAYDEVIARYPGSGAEPQARYKRASVLQSLGQLDAAKIEYETVVSDYPDSAEARLAQQRLDSLLRPPQ